MQAQLAIGHGAIEAALAECAGADPAVREQLRTQLNTIAGLHQQIGTASMATLSALQFQVVAIVSSAATAAQEARASALLSSSSPVGMSMFASAAREQVNTVMAGMKDFDKYLQFGPGDTEADYRQREAERLAYIAAQHGKHTPEGDLNASGAAIGQMADAKAHGADASPEFQKRADGLIEAAETLRAQMVREGRSTKEFDDRLREDVRRTLKAKGLSDADIDAQFAAHEGDPLQTAKAFMKSEDDLKQLNQSVQTSSDLPQRTSTIIVADDKPLPPDGMASAIAKLQSAGVTAAPQQVAENIGHGVARYDGPSQTSVRGA